MKRLTIWMLVGLLAHFGVGLVGCSDDDDGQHDAGPDAYVPPDVTIPDAGDAGPTSATIFGRIFDIEGNEDLVDVNVCWDGGNHNACVVSSSFSGYSLQDLPPNTDGTITLTRTDLVDAVWWITSPPGLMEDTFSMGDASEILFVYDSASASPVAGQGTLWVDALEVVMDVGVERVEAVVGATIAISPNAGDGPHYMHGDLELGVDPNLSATGGSGTAVYLNVPAGDYSVSVTYGGNECRLGRYSTVPGPRDVTVAANILTASRFWCGEP